MGGLSAIAQGHPRLGPIMNAFAERRLREQKGDAYEDWAQSLIGESAAEPYLAHANRLAEGAGKHTAWDYLSKAYEPGAMAERWNLQKVKWEDELARRARREEGFDDFATGLFQDPETAQYAEFAQRLAPGAGSSSAFDWFAGAAAPPGLGELTSDSVPSQIKTYEYFRNLDDEGKAMWKSIVPGLRDKFLKGPAGSRFVPIVGADGKYSIEYLTTPEEHVEADYFTRLAERSAEIETANDLYLNQGLGRQQALNLAQLPMAMVETNEILKSIDDLTEQEGLGGILGLQGVAAIDKFIPGTRKHDLSKELYNMQAKVYAYARMAEEGKGPLTEQEANTLAESVEALMSSISEEQFRKNLGDFRNRVNKVQEAKRSMAQGNFMTVAPYKPNTPTAPSVTGPGGTSVPTYDPVTKPWK